MVKFVLNVKMNVINVNSKIEIFQTNVNATIFMRSLFPNINYFKKNLAF